MHSEAKPRIELSLADVFSIGAIGFGLTWAAMAAVFVQPQFRKMFDELRSLQAEHLPF